MTIWTDEDTQQRLATLRDMLGATDDLSSANASPSLPWARAQEGFIAPGRYISWKRFTTCVLDHPEE